MEAKMRKQVLRTSAIALGVAAALPATGQEWNLQWGGFMNQHFVFGSTEQKHTTSKMDDVSYTIKGDHNGRTTGGDFEMTVKFIGGDDLPENAPDAFAATVPALTSAEADSVFIAHATTVFDNPEDDGFQFVSGSIYEALSQAVTNSDRQIKKIYIHSQELPSSGDNAGVISSISVADIAAFAQNLESSNFNVASGSNVTPQNLNGIEIYIVGPNSDITTAIENDANNAKRDITNAYGQVSAAIANATSTVDLSGSGQRRNTEVHFKPSVTLENGITFAAAIELEGDAGGVDRSNMTISSDSLGKITLGAHSSMGYGMMVAAPSVGLGINDGAHHNFIPVSKGGAAGGTFLEVGGNWEPMRVSYQSPSLAGLTLGLSYAADGKGNGNSANHSGYLKAAEGHGDLSDIFDVAAKFSQSLGETNVTLAARYGTAEQEGYSDKPRVVAVGGQVSFGGFTIGAGYADEEAPAGVDNDGWSLGASFKPTEAWTIGIETYQGEYDNGDDHSVSKIAASRNLGPGVAWNLYAITAESTSTTNGLTVTQGGKEYELHSVNKTEGSGTIFGTSINLSF